MVYTCGALALVLWIFVFVLLRIAFDGKKVYHNVAAAIAGLVVAPAGYYAVAFFVELGKVLMGSAP